MTLRATITGEVISREDFLGDLEERLLDELDSEYRRILMALASNTSIEERINLADEVQKKLLAKILKKKHLARFIADRMRNAEAVAKIAHA